MIDRLLALRIAAIGMLMGAAEVVPGVSGGTIAFISGIYERLLNALRQFTPGLVTLLFRHGIGAAWARIDGTFLLILFGGMGVSILGFASAISYLLEHEQVAIWSFFFGLVIASVWVVTRQISRFGFDLVLAAVTGAAVGMIISTLLPVEVSPTPIFVFAAGAVAVCAWILPGLSGSFILLILGLYAFVIDAIRSFDVITLAALGAGCAIGLVTFAQVLSRLMQRFRDETLAVLTGFMVGSLVKLWPWKNTLSYQLKEDGSQIPVVQEPVWPTAYESLTGQDPDLLLAAGSLVAGLLLVLAVHFMARASAAEHSW